MKPGSLTTTLVCLFMAILLAASCRREKENVYPDNTNTDSTAQDTTKCKLSGNYHIIVSGGKYVNDSFRFDTDIPACAKRTWFIQYPDGTSQSVTAHAVQLKLSMVGSYNVTLVVNDDDYNYKGFNVSERVTAFYPYNSGIVQQMNKTYNWSVKEDSLFYINIQPQQIRTIKQYEEAAAITVVDSTTIQFKGQTLKAWSYDIANGVIDKYTFTSTLNNDLEWYTLKYYYRQDSIVCSFHPYQGGSPEIGKKPAQPYGVTTTYKTKK